MTWVRIYRSFKRSLQSDLTPDPANVLRRIELPQNVSHCRHRAQSTAVTAADLPSLLERPSWSVRSLLPESSATADCAEITSKQLHHLLRLSALPAPKSEDEERRMLQTLSSQLHFVKKVQSVDTKGVEPLRSIRDETPEAARENSLTMEKLRDAFDKEEVKGWTRRIERKKALDADTKIAEDWDVLGQASRKVGRYFVVESTQVQ